MDFIALNDLNHLYNALTDMVLMQSFNIRLMSTESLLILQHGMFFNEYETIAIRAYLFW